MGVPDEPEESFGRGVFFRLELGGYEGLEGGGGAGGGELTVSYFLRRGQLEKGGGGGWVERETLMLPSMSFLTGVKATEPSWSGRECKRTCGGQPAPCS